MVDIRRMSRRWNAMARLARISPISSRRNRTGGPKGCFLLQAFCRKEACSKALGTGFRRGVFWKDMGVVNEPSGRPTLQLTGGAKEQLERITPPGHTARIQLTITDDFPYAQAVVIIEAVAVS